MKFSDGELEVLLDGLDVYISNKGPDLDQDVYDLALRISEYLENIGSNNNGR